MLSKLSSSIAITKAQLRWGKNLESHARSKHVDILWHYQREKIEVGSVELKYVPTAEQIAGGLIKPLTKENFLIYQKALGLEEHLYSAS